ncbi:MAG: AI-2E family transporter [Alphaproteobacteria bacterium]|nr:AI-2E family transporter [Alphaproteobacteria bacterium]
MQLPKDPQKLTLMAALVLAVMALGVALSAVLSPFLMATALAYLLAGGVARLQHLGLPRPLAVLLVELLFILVVLALAALVVPVLAHEWPLLRDQLPVLAQKIDAWLTPWLHAWGIDLRLDVESVKAFVRDHLSDNLGDGAARMLSSLRLGGSVVLAVVGHAILVPVALYYLLLAWPRLMVRLRQALPLAWRAPVGEFLTDCDQVMGGYLRGQLSVMAAMALFYAVTLQLGGLDLAWPIGIFTGLALCVPYVGFGIGLALALLAALLEFEPMYALLLVGGVYGLGQMIEGFALTPRWVGERIGLHPLAVIFALLAFGQLLGFVGVLLALPASAMLVVAWRHLVSNWLAKDQDAA